MPRSKHGAVVRVVILVIGWRQKQRLSFGRNKVAQYLRDSPIEHEHFAKRSNHDVLRFEIAMNNSVRMRKRHRIANSLKLP